MNGRTVFCVGALLVNLVNLAPLAHAQTTDPLLDRAKRLMREVPLIDGHNDLPWEIRTRFALSLDSLDISKDKKGVVMTDLARLKSGMVGGQFWSIYSPHLFIGRGAARVGFEQVDVVHRMEARYPQALEPAYTAADIVRIHRAGKVASLMGLEGGHMIENSVGVLREFYRAGIRYMTLTWNGNTDWADAAADSMKHRGLTRFGEEVVREMNRLGMLVDLSHVSDSTMWDVLRVSQAPVIYSHSSARHFTPHLRNVPDDILREVAKNRGVVMVNYVPQFIYRPAWDHSQRQAEYGRRLRATMRDTTALADSLRLWARANPMPLPDMKVVADHIEHIRSVAGVDNVALGSDLDGIEQTPVGLEDVSTYPALIAELLRRGWSDADAKKLIGENTLRAMREAETIAARLQRERGPSVAQIEIVDRWPTRPPWAEPGK